MRQNILFKRNILLFGVLILSASIFAVPAYAGGLPHPVYGIVKTSTGQIPTKANLTITAYITTRSADTMSYPKGIPDIQYEEKSGTWQIEVSSFQGTWAAGEILHINFYDVSGKSNSREVTLTHDAFQNSDEVLLPIELAQDKDWQTTQPISRRILCREITDADFARLMSQCARRQRLPTIFAQSARALAADGGEEGSRAARTKKTPPKRGFCEARSA